MFLKLAAIVALLGVCCCLPVDDPKVAEIAPASGVVPLEPQPVKVEGSPKPSKPDDSDLKTDASSWWHSWYHHENPTVVYYPRSYPVYKTYWKTYY